MRYNLWKTAVPSTLIMLGSVGLTACGDDADSGSMPGMDHNSPSTSPTAATSSPGTPAATFDDADVAFATQMIPHHQQAVEMAGMAKTRATSAEVKRLATAINAAQGPEIKTMSGWLRSWGKPVPSPGHAMHMGSEMPGMMTEAEMAELGKASGAMFDRMWTQMMIKHHKGAVSMAKTEQTTGRYGDAVALAKKIESDQNREISMMQQLLGRLSTS